MTAEPDRSVHQAPPEYLKSIGLVLAEEDPAKRADILDTLGEHEQDIVAQVWEIWARGNQLSPVNEWWRVWLIMAGRGWGKTRAGAEWINKMARDEVYKRFHLVGATAADIRDIMIEGPSGIIQTSPSWFKARYYPTKRRIEWPNGAWALAFSADEPERLRGEQCEAAWCDELASWRYDEAWLQLMLGLRLGDNPRVVVTTTPRPTSRIKDLVVKTGTTYMTNGSTYENFDNLAQAYTEIIVEEYEGTRIGRQELHAEILADAEGALWDSDGIEEDRVTRSEVPLLERIIIAVDPAITFGEDSNETGIIVCGRSSQGHGYILEDSSGKLKPEQWANRVIALYHKWNADRVVAEKNQGGDMVQHTIQVYDPGVAVKLVHASKNKETRAEPVAGLYEQNKIHHVGNFSLLEEQLVSWEPGFPSPDRLDALVWGLTELFIGPNITRFALLSKETDLQTEGSYWKQY